MTNDMKKRDWKQGYSWDGTFRCTDYNRGGTFYPVSLIPVYYKPPEGGFFLRGGFHVYETASG
jgi:hypothetical protein